jgi:hypothetical protein
LGRGINYLTHCADKLKDEVGLMKIASLGPHVVAPAHPDSENYKFEDQISPVLPPEDSPPAQTETPGDQEKAKFSRLFNLIKTAEKNGKLKGSNKNRKRMRALKKYLVQKEAVNPQETIGTILKHSI